MRAICSAGSIVGENQEPEIQKAEVRIRERLCLTELGSEVATLAHKVIT